MFRNNRTMAYVMVGIAGVAVALALGLNPAFLLFLAICPLMMFFMMWSMGNMGAHDHGFRDNDRDSDDRVDRDAKTGR